jgi:hypothetical protein
MAHNNDQEAPRRGASSIEQFCKDHNFSQSQYYAMRKVGRGPDEMAVGRRRLISDEAAERWRRDRERDARRRTR